jgi:hypothetical protein
MGLLSGRLDEDERKSIEAVIDRISVLMRDLPAKMAEWTPIPQEEVHEFRELLLKAIDSCRNNDELRNHTAGFEKLLNGACNHVERYSQQQPVIEQQLNQFSNLVQAIIDPTKPPSEADMTSLHNLYAEIMAFYDICPGEASADAKEQISGAIESVCHIYASRSTTAGG